MNYILIISIIFGLTGCFPKIKNTTPTVELQMIDSRSLKPIANVLSSENIESNVLGKLNIPAKREWGIALPVSGVYVIGKRIAVGKKGYVSQVCQCEALTVHAKCEPYVLKLNFSNSDDEVTVQSLKDLVQLSKKRFYDRANPYALPEYYNQEVVCTEGE